MVRIIPLKTPSALGHDPLNHPLDGRVLEVLGEPGYGQLPPVGAKVVVTEEDGVEVHDIRQFVKDPEVLPSTHLHLKGSCRGLDRGSFLSQLGILQPDMVSRIRHLTTLTCLAKYLLMEESVYSTLDLFRTQLWPKVVSRPFPQEVISPLEDLDSFLPWFVQHLEGRVLHTELSLERLVLNTTWIAGCCRLLVVGLPRLASSQAYLTFLLQALGETESSSSCEGVESLRRQLGITNCYAVGMPSPVTSALPRKPPPPERAASSDSFLEAFTGRLGTPNARARKVVRRTARADVRSDAGRRGSLVVVEFDGPEAARKLWDRLTQGYAHFSGRRLFAFADPVGLVSVTERLCPRLSSGLASRPPQSAPNAQLTVYLPRVSQDCMAALNVFFNSLRQLSSKVQGPKECFWNLSLGTGVLIFPSTEVRDCWVSPGDQCTINVPASLMRAPLTSGEFDEAVLGSAVSVTGSRFSLGPYVTPCVLGRVEAFQQCLRRCQATVPPPQPTTSPATAHVSSDSSPKGAPATSRVSSESSPKGAPDAIPRRAVVKPSEASRKRPPDGQGVVRLAKKTKREENQIDLETLTREERKEHRDLRRAEKERRRQGRLRRREAKPADVQASQAREAGNSAKTTPPADVQPSQAREAGNSAKTTPPADVQPSQAREAGNCAKATPEVRPVVNSATASPNANRSRSSSAKASPETRSAKASPETRSAKASPETRSAKASPETRSVKASPEARASPKASAASRSRSSSVKASPEVRPAGRSSKASPDASRSRSSSVKASGSVRSSSEAGRSMSSSVKGNPGPPAPKKPIKCQASGEPDHPRARDAFGPSKPVRASKRLQARQERRRQEQKPD